MAKTKQYNCTPSHQNSRYYSIVDTSVQLGGCPPQTVKRRLGVENT